MYKIKTGDVLKTRDGRSVRIICVDVKGADKGRLPIVALIDDGDWETPVFYFPSGKYLATGEHNYDLILPQPKTKRVAPIIYRTLLGDWERVHHRLVTKDQCPGYAHWCDNSAEDVPDDS